MDSNFETLRTDLVLGSRRAWPVLILGILYLLFLAVAPLALTINAICLLWIGGMGIVFPLLLLFPPLRGGRGNPFRRLGLLLVVMQIFFIPVDVIVYRELQSYVPFAVALLSAAYFVPAAWLYRSPAFAFIAIMSWIAAVVLGGGPLQVGGFLQYWSFVFVPLAIAAIYLIGTIWILIGNRRTRRHAARGR